MAGSDDPFATERRWRWFGRIMLVAMAVAVAAIALLAE